MLNLASNVWIYHCFLHKKEENRCVPKKVLTFSPTYGKFSKREIGQQKYSFAAGPKVSSRSGNEIKKRLIKFYKPRPVGGEPMAGLPKGRRIPLVEGGVKAPPENASVQGGLRPPCTRVYFRKNNNVK